MVEEILAVEKYYRSFDGGLVAHATKNNPARALRQVQRGANRLSNSFNDRLFRDLFQAIFTAATARLRKFGQENGLWRFCGLHLRWTLTPDSCDGARDRRADWQRRRRVAKRRALRCATLHLREHRAPPSKHSSLHNHPLDDTRQGRHRKNSRAVWITLRYRAIYVVDGETNVWYWIGSHEDYNIFTGAQVGLLRSQWPIGGDWYLVVPLVFKSKAANLVQ